MITEKEVAQIKARNKATEEIARASGVRLGYTQIFLRKLVKTVTVMDYDWGHREWIVMDAYFQNYWISQEDLDIGLAQVDPA